MLSAALVPLCSSDAVNTTRVSADSVRAFYDDFLKSRMIEYRLTRNIRIEKATTRVLFFLEKDSTVLDIGCGIGMVAERIAKFASRGRVYACDLSEQNIWYANQTIDAPNLAFRAIDVVHDFDVLAAWVPSHAVNVVVMIDVLEHVPLALHTALFRSLREILSDNGTIVLTFPSPAYQAYLQANDKSELQIVDESIDVEHALSVCRDAGFFIKHYSLEDVWMKNQYVHCVLQATDSVSPIVESKDKTLSGVLRRAARKTRRTWRYHVVRRLLHRKYVDRIFGPSARQP